MTMSGRLQKKLRNKTQAQAKAGAKVQPESAAQLAYERASAIDSAKELGKDHNPAVAALGAPSPSHPEQDGSLLAEVEQAGLA